MQISNRFLFVLLHPRQTGASSAYRERRQMQHAACVQHAATRNACSIVHASCNMPHARIRRTARMEDGIPLPTRAWPIIGTDTTCSTAYSIDWAAHTAQCAHRWANNGSSSLPARVQSGWAHIEPRSLRVLCVLRADLLLDHRLDLSTAPQRALLSTHKTPITIRSAIR